MARWEPVTERRGRGKGRRGSRTSWTQTSMVADLNTQERPLPDHFMLLQRLRQAAAVALARHLPLPLKPPSQRRWPHSRAAGGPFEWPPLPESEYHVGM